MAINNRVYFAIEELAIAPMSTLPFTSAHVAHGVQSAGINTRFNLEQVFELGQLEIYENVENLPDVEITVEKCLDGKPLLYHLGTYGAPSPTLSGRSNQRASIAMSIFADTQDASSGTPIAQVYVSGVYVSAVNYNFPVDGSFTESVTFVGNNKLWLTSAFTLTGYMDNTDSPANYPAVGIGRRQHFILGSGNVTAGSYTGPPSILPIDVDGVNPSGYVLANADGTYNAHIQSVRVSSNFGREQLNELGHKAPYFRYVNFPVEVRCDIEILSTRGDMVSATEAGVLGNGNNLSERPIFISTLEGTKINLGNKNKLNTVTMGGGNAGNRGGNATVTYSYVTFNDLLVIHPADPTTAFAA